MKCWVIKGQRDTKIQPKREGEGDRKTMRTEEKSFGGEGGRKKLTQIEFARFSSIDLKQIFIMSALQATGSEISPSAQAPEDLTQTGCPSLTVTGLGLLREDVLIIHCAEVSSEPWWESYRLCALNCNKQSGNQVAVSSWCQGRQIDPSDGLNGDTGPSQRSPSHPRFGYMLASHAASSCPPTLHFNPGDDLNTNSIIATGSQSEH